MAVRYTIDGQVKEGDILDDLTGTSHTSNDTDGKNRKSWEDILDDVLGDLRNVTAGVKEKQPKSGASVADAIAKSRKIRDAEAKFRNPGTENVTVGHSGLFRTADLRDQALSDTDRAIRNLTIVLSHLVTLVGQYDVNGKRFVMDGIYQMLSMDDEYPASMRPFGELMNERSIAALMETFLQGQELLAIEGIKAIAEAWASPRSFRR
jgi:hypothetical protein